MKDNCWGGPGGLPNLIYGYDYERNVDTIIETHAVFVIFAIAAPYWIDDAGELYLADIVVRGGQIVYLLIDSMFDEERGDILFNKKKMLFCEKRHQMVSFRDREVDQDCGTKVHYRREALPLMG